MNAGDLSGPEAVLTAQAQTSDAIFDNLARRAIANLNAGYGDAAERYLRQSMKAQSQSRATLEALAEMKDPHPIAFVKHANIAAGHQQANNAPGDQSRAREIESTQNKVLETSRGDWLDTETQSTASRVDKELAAVGEVNGTENDGRQSQG